MSDKKEGKPEEKSDMDEWKDKFKGMLSSTAGLGDVFPISCIYDLLFRPPRNEDGCDAYWAR